jgi:hypothetical protein
MNFFTPNDIPFATIAFLLGCLTAFAELLSRYNQLRQIMTLKPSLIYLLINGITSGLAYIFLVEMEMLNENVIGRVFLAGSSAMIILRSSLASIKVGDRNIEAGGAAILQVFLNSADRAFDRMRSQSEIEQIERVMKDVSFEKAKLALPMTCFTIMKNVSQDEQDLISGEVKKLEEVAFDNHTKAINLGTVLMNVTGIDLLEKSVKVLGKSITREISKAGKTDNSEGASNPDNKAGKKGKLDALLERLK